MAVINSAEPKYDPRMLLKRMIPVVIFGWIVLIALALAGDLRVVSAYLSQFNWNFFPIALGFTLFNYSLRFLKWHFYTYQVGAKGLHWQHSLRLFVAGFPLAFTPGKVGEAIKAVWLKRATGVPTARGVAVIVAERISDGLAVLALSVLGVVANPQYWLAFLIILVVLLGLVLVSQIRPLALAVLDLGARMPLIKKIIPALREFYEGSYSLFKPGTTFLAVGLGTISWLGEGIGFYFILRGLGLASSNELLANAIFILAFSTIIGAVSALPGGLGASEASIAGMLVLVAGADTALAAAATLLIRLATLWFGIFLGLLTWAVSPQLLDWKSVQKNPTKEESA